MPQVHIVLVIWLSNNGYINRECEHPVQFQNICILTFTLSVLCGTFGVAKFVKSGPAGIINNEKCLMGFCSVTFILLILNIGFTLIGRGIVIASFVICISSGVANKLRVLLVVLCFIPQLLHVSSCALAKKVHLHTSFNYLPGIPYSLFCPWHQEGNNKSCCTSGPSTDTLLQLLDLWASEIGQLLHL